MTPDPANTLIASVGAVPRIRLTDRLLSSPPAPLVVLAAPAGYSKTTTLRAWAAAERRPVPWVTCDWRHNDPAVFLQAIARELGGARELDEETITVLGVEASWPDSALARLGAALDQPGPDFALVIDDAHLLESEDSVTLLGGLCDALPPGGQLVIGSRTSPPLRLGRMRANRSLVELGIRELRMTRLESRMLLNEAGLDLEDEQLDVIHDRTEGWPAALQLAAIALADRDDVEEAVEAFAGNDRVVVEYLREEFLSVSDPELVSFMTRTSVLEELSGSLCDAALERTGSAEVLLELARSNALVIPMDRRGDTFRYHHLLSDMLRAELNRSEPEIGLEIHRRASASYERESRIRSAVEHAILSRDSCLSGRLIWASFPELSGRGQIATLTRWLDEVGQDHLTECHGLMLSAAHSSMAMGSGERARYWLTLAETIDSRSGCPVPVESDLWILRATCANEGVATMAGDAAKACELKDPDDVWYGAALFYRGVGTHLLGDHVDGEVFLRDAARRTAVLSPIIQSLALSQLALMALDREAVEEAKRLASEAGGQVERCGIAEYPAMALVFAAGAAVSAAEGRSEKARTTLERGSRMLARLNGFPPWYETQARAALAGACLHLGDLDTARRLLDEARIHLEMTSDAVVLDKRLTRLEESLREKQSQGLELTSNLTKAETRTLQYLPTHLTFRQIGALNDVSANTVKTQARAVYRKLGVNSRAEAVDRARRDGLLGDDQVKMI
jgi:LuxR family maltose regulon positive regulatory protein